MKENKTPVNTTIKDEPNIKDEIILTKQIDNEEHAHLEPTKITHTETRPTKIHVNLFKK